MRAGLTVPALHELWLRGRSGDQAADQQLRGLLESKPAVWEVVDTFAAGVGPKVGSKLHFALTKAIVFKKPQSIWSTAKAKWVSVQPGGLPTLGKRR